MKGQELVIDANVFYTFINESSYNDKFHITITLLHNILLYCENKICINDEIFVEFDKFIKKAEQSEYNNLFKSWYVQMQMKSKFKYVQCATYIEPKIHHKDVKYYQTAKNSNSKIFVTCEKKLLKERDSICEEFEINTLTIEEANERVVKFHNDV